MLKNRNITSLILENLSSHEIIFLLGTRQTGKTTLTRLIAEKSNYTKGHIFFVDFEDKEYRALYNNASIASLQSLFLLEGIPYEQKCLLIFDEIQLLEDPANLMKLLHDHFPNLKVITTGSSSLQIKNKFTDSLAGRKQVYQIEPLSFDEFLEFKNEKRALQLRAQFQQNPKSKVIANMVARLHDYMLALLEEYLVFGGYPEVVLSSSRQQKVEKLMSIANAYIQKDIRDIANIENIEGYNNLLVYLAVNCGSEINYSSLQKTIKLSNPTLLKYLSYLQETFIVKQLHPFFSNKNKEISKNKKLFFKDTGVRNLQIKNFNLPNIRPDAGVLYENYIFNVLDNNRSLLQEVFFYRTQSQTEIDFIVRNENAMTLIEVKSGNHKKRPKAVLEFSNKYKDTYSINKQMIVNQSYLNVKDDVWFVPAYLF